MIDFKKVAEREMSEMVMRYQARALSQVSTKDDVLRALEAMRDRCETEVVVLVTLLELFRRAPADVVALFTGLFTPERLEAAMAEFNRVRETLELTNEPPGGN